MSTLSLKLNYSSPRHQTAVSRFWFLSNALSFSQVLKKFTGGLNAKNFCSMHIMHELPTNKANFLIKTTQDFNSSRHAAPHLPIVFTDNIILYFNWIRFVLHVFKRSHNAHIMFIFGHFTVYAYRTSKFFCKKNPWIFISRQETISGMKLLDLLSISDWLQLSRMLICSK